MSKPCGEVHWITVNPELGGKPSKCVLEAGHIGPHYSGGGVIAEDDVDGPSCLECGGENTISDLGFNPPQYLCEDCGNLWDGAYQPEVE